ncbi:MAG: hypothetical protein OXF11_01060 [Deltaproteobacteria bacterium]|nr:hypothetical protein [Deltaproteobacteria bacterium]
MSGVKEPGVGGRFDRVAGPAPDGDAGGAVIAHVALVGNLAPSQKGDGVGSAAAGLVALMTIPSLTVLEGLTGKIEIPAAC